MKRSGNGGTFLKRVFRRNGGNRRFSKLTCFVTKNFDQIRVEREKSEASGIPLPASASLDR